jgi:hypothetical protein
VAKIVALQPQIAAAEQAWSALAARAKVLLQTGDKTLSQYQLIAQTSAAGAADLPQLARSINDAVKAGEPIDAFVKQTFSRDDLFDKAAFAQAQAARSPGAATATMQDVQAWLTRAADYRKLTSDPRGKPDRWDGELGSVASHLKLIVDIPAAADASQGIQRRLEQVKAQLSELQKIAPLAMNQSRITKQTAAVEDEVAKLALDVRTQVARHTIDPAQWLKTQRETESISIVNKSAAIDGAWRRGRDALLKDVNEAALKADPTKLPALQDQVRRLRESLEQLDGDQRLAQLSDSVGAPAWQDRARKEVWNQRESAMATCVSALAGVAEGKPVVDDAAFVGKRDQTAKSYRAWVESFVQKLRLAERLETAMDQARLLSEPMDDSDATTVDATAASLLSDKQMAWLTTDEQALVRVKALRAMGKAAIIERAALATKASGGAGEPLVIRRAAWRALGETSSQQWPANLQELEAERDMAAALERDMTADATLANDKARLGVLTAEIAAQSRVRWERAFVAISGRSDLDKARAMMAAIGVDEAKLAPAARYRLSLLSLAEKIAAARVEKADDEKLRSILDTFTRGMTAELRGTEPAKKLLTKLGELTDSQKSSGKAASLGSVGPGKSGWTAQPSPDGDSVVYTHPSAPMRVEFIRVASGGRDAKACYLAATELSVSQFLQACADAGDASHSWVKRWDVVNSADPRRGPRVWDLDNSGVRIASTWLDEKTSASAGDGSRPGPDHPMQWLPVTGAMELAASLGCRLPTVAEWSAAAKSAQNTQTQTNLRDKRYQAQMARAAGVQGLKQPWPADGIFRLASERGSPSTDDKLVTDTDDGTLWFAPVGATNDEASSSTSAGKETARFWHLRGNVAEYVTLASQGDKTAPQDVMVIGESALSPPRQERDQPLPIGASQASTGCSDVGLRLAFDAPFESLAASVSKLLASDDVWGFAGKAK